MKIINLGLLIVTIILSGLLQSSSPIPAEVEPELQPVLVNNPPHIITMKTSQTIVEPSSKCRISCIANDDDGDVLSYLWSAEKGDMSGEGYKITWTAPGKEGIYPIDVVVTDSEDIAESSINVTVKQNNIPSISSIVPSANWLQPFDSCTLVCRASDPDGDKLDYKWNTYSGTISGQGPIVVWNAPEQPGPHDIVIIVSDSYGGRVARMFTINVATIHPPVIEDFVITAKETKFFREYEDEYKILHTNSCSIECVVTNSTGELTFSWSAEKGKISGDGAIVTWTPPHVKGLVSITVKVTDAENNMDEKELVFKVEKCSCVFT